MKILTISICLIAVCLVAPSFSVQAQFDEDATFNQLSEAILNSADLHTEVDTHKSFIDESKSKSFSGFLFKKLFDNAVAQLKAKLSNISVAVASKDGKVVLNVKQANAVLASWASDVRINVTSAKVLTSAAMSNISMNAHNKSTYYTAVLYSSLQITAVNSTVRSLAIKSSEDLSLQSCSALLITVHSDLTAGVADSKVDIANIASTVKVTADKGSTIKWLSNKNAWDENDSPSSEEEEKL